MNLKEKEIVSILGGKLKNNSKKRVVVPILIIALMTVAFISPFGSFVVVVDKGESSTISSTTAVSTTVTTTTKEMTTKKPEVTERKSTVATEAKVTSTTTIAATKRAEEPTKKVKPQVPTTAAITTEREDATTKQVTTKKDEATSKPSTTKVPTTTYVEKTTQKPTTTTPIPPRKVIVPEIEAWPDNCNDFVVVNYCAYPQGGNFSLKVSEGFDVVRVRDSYIYPVKAGKATVDVLWTYEDKVAKDTLNITVGVEWSDIYETELKQENNELNVLLSERQEHQLYRWLCNACGYRDCYVKTETTTCHDSYNQSNCNGKFTVLETKWFSDIDPQTMSCHSFSGIKSVLLGDGSEWYWTGSKYNTIRTIYEYKTGAYYIESIT